MTGPVTGAGEWLRSSPGQPPAPVRIVCFAHAGGNASSFLQWQPALAGEAELIAVCPPGKAQRAREPRLDLAALLAGAAGALVDSIATDRRPVYLFGHSFGALAAFEVARRLTGQPELRHLVLSGLGAPSLLPTPRVRKLAGLDPAEFADELAFFGGVPPEVLAEQELREFLLPGVQADFKQAAEYRYYPADRLRLDASLINGRQDPHVSGGQLAGWRDEFVEPPAEHWADGGHFYFED
ncbi:MAG: alpha/beta fold hydrolase, partial [Jatrophihabitantaceae bacterium]